MWSLGLGSWAWKYTPPKHCLANLLFSWPIFSQWLVFRFSTMICIYISQMNSMAQHQNAIILLRGGRNLTRLTEPWVI